MGNGSYSKPRRMRLNCVLQEQAHRQLVWRTLQRGIIEPIGLVCTIRDPTDQHGSVAVCSVDPLRENGRSAYMVQSGRAAEAVAHASERRMD
jgi:hypothetical protein